jgi:hypothetical protein
MSKSHSHDATIIEHTWKSGNSADAFNATILPLVVQLHNHRPVSSRSDHLLQDHNIEELMKNGMDPNSSSMQDMVSNVSKDIQSRIGGEVNQEQLMKESTDLLGSLGEERWS